MKMRNSSEESGNTNDEDEVMMMMALKKEILLLPFQSYEIGNDTSDDERVNFTDRKQWTKEEVIMLSSP